MSEDVVLVRQDGPVAVVTLNRPQAMNALSGTLRRELARAHQCDATCPVSTAIFLRVAAEAAIENLQQGTAITDISPFWRVIAPDSTIARKLPVDSAWLAHQRALEQA